MADSEALASRDAEAAALRERVARLEGLIGDLQVGVLVHGPRSEILFSNETALRLLGLTREQLVGAPSLDRDWNAVYEDGSPFAGEAHPAPTAIRTREPVRNVVMGVDRPALGDRVWLMVNADPILDAVGDVERVVCTFSDVTERRRAEAALRERDSLNRRILEAVPGGIMHVAADGMIVEANREALRMAGRGRDELRGMNVNDFAGATMWEDGTPCPADAHPATKCLRTGRRTPPSTIGVRRPDGTISWAVYSAVPMFDPDSRRVTGAVVTSVDITERKQMEEHLRHVQRVEAVARLAGGIAHHFNNLLTVVGGYSSLMMKRLSPGEPLYEDACEIRKASDRAAHLTRQLLAFNRRDVVDRRVVDVNAVVAEMRQMLEALFGELVQFDVSLDAAPATVWADPAQIEDIVLNLAVNARDAMPGGGTFRLATRNTGLDEVDGRHPALRPGRYVVLEVVDSGIGMAPEVVDHIFEPFFTTKEVGQGTGLGLSTVHEIVSLSGGRIEVRSEPGRGAAFTVFLPEVDVGGARETASPVRDVRRGRETVLVVEDDAAVRTYLRETLLRNGYRVLEAADGRAALELADRYPGSISLLVADVVMPEVGGPEVARRMLAVRPHLRVVLVSGYAGDALAPDLDGLAIETLDKPFTADAFIAKVRDVLDEPA